MYGYVCYRISSCVLMLSFFFVLHATPTTDIYTLSLHDALPILTIKSLPTPCKTNAKPSICQSVPGAGSPSGTISHSMLNTDRKSTRLNSSHRCISYAVFCLKKKKKQKTTTTTHNKPS